MDFRLGLTHCTGLLAAWLMAGSPGTASAAGDGTTTGPLQHFQGTVTLVDTHEPLPGTTVTARSLRRQFLEKVMSGAMVLPTNQDLEDRATTVTDQAGRYRLEVEEPESGNLTWVEARTTAGLRGSGSMSRDMVMNIINPVSRSKRTVDISVRPAALVEGIVQDDRGAALTSVTVRLSQKPSPQMFDSSDFVSETTLTTARGRFQFPGAGKGLSYFISVEHTGFEPATVEVSAPSSGTLIKLRSGGGSVAGTLFDLETKRPVPETTITLTAMPKDFGMRMTIPKTFEKASDKAGEFEFTGLPGGTYAAQVQKKGYQVFRGKGSISPVQPGGYGITVESGETTAGLEIYLFAGFTIEGQVVTEDGKPLAGVDVSTTWDGKPVDGDPELNDVTGENGRFQVKANNINGGSGGDTQMLFIRVDKKGWVLPKKRGQGNYGPGRVVVAIDPHGTRFKDVKVTMEESLTVNGRVLSSPGVPASGAEIKAWSRNFDYDRQDWPKTDAKGYYSVDVGRESEVVVQATHPVLGQALSDSVSMDDRPTTIPDIILNQWASLSGTVVDPEGKPFSGATVYGYSNIMVGNFGHSFSPPGSPAQTDASGKFEMAKVTAGTLVTVRAAAETYAPSETISVNLQPGEKKSDVKLVLRKPMEISGRVVDEEGKAAANVRVSCWSQASNANAMSDADGKFVLKNLAEGTYQVNANSPNGSSEASKTGVAAGTTDLELVLKSTRPGARGSKAPKPTLLKGTVVDSETNKPIPNISVKEGMYPQGITIGTSKAEPGEFTAELSNPGIRLVISAPGYAPLYTESINYSPSEELIERTFQLEQGRTLRARLLDGDNQPAENVRVRLLVQGEPWIAQQSEPVATTRSDAEGRIEFQSVRSGLQRLDIRPSAPLISFIHEANVPTGKGELDLGDISLSTGGSLRVTVRNASTGKVQPQAAVRVIRQDSSGGRQTPRDGKTGDDGTVLMDRLQAGSYSVQASTDPTMQGASSSKTAKVENGKQSEVTVQIGNSRVTVKLLRASAPVAGQVTAVIKPQDGSVISAYSQEGIIKFSSLVAGEYEFTGQVYGSGNRPTTAKVTATIRDGDNPDVILKVPNATVKGVVVDTAGKVVVGAAVSLTSALALSGDDTYLQFSSNVETDTQGRFEFVMLSAGTYNLAARKDGVGLALQPGLVLATADSKAEGLSLVLRQDGGTLVNVALDIETGRPIPEAWCHVRNEQGRFPHGATRKSDGTLTIENLPPGRYLTEVSSFGYSSENQEVEIVAGETARQETVLYVAGALRWTVVPTGGVNLSDISLSLKPDDANSIEEPRSGKPDGQGLWVVRGLAPGQYTGTISRQGKPDITISTTIIRREVQSARTEVGP